MGFTFSFSCKLCSCYPIPLYTVIAIPPKAIIRAMAIHKTPEKVGDVLQCCPKHIEEQRKKGKWLLQCNLTNPPLSPGHQYPNHFICGAAKSDTIYCEDPISGRLSITVPIATLQQSKPTTSLHHLLPFLPQRAPPVFKPSLCSRASHQSCTKAMDS